MESKLFKEKAQLEQSLEVHGIDLLSHNWLDDF